MVHKLTVLFIFISCTCKILNVLHLVISVLLVVFCQNDCVVVKTETGSPSGPALFTSSEVVYNSTKQLNGLQYFFTYESECKVSRANTIMMYKR